LEVCVTIRRGIGDTPELSLAGFNRDLRPDFAIQSEDPLDWLLLFGCSTVASGNTNLLQEPVANFGLFVLQVAVAQDKHALTHVSKLWIISVDAINDDGS